MLGLWSLRQQSDLVRFTVSDSDAFRCLTPSILPPANPAAGLEVTHSVAQLVLPTLSPAIEALKRLRPCAVTSAGYSWSCLTLSSLL
ncbi:hypothetical protein M404DRAFT_305813 [Pisolithus tinctorius Marx 270]|uniref:Uncharacterized protein n=1 Tax=Pisolithus tinctorius Marx 270 TaxID=870435 RepID=A0A0C3JIU5_PISTI|nr:hypothetical protein M404DRAFT_305813 [Pisolithus tinctorius Marx 270]